MKEQEAMTRSKGKYPPREVLIEPPVEENKDRPCLRCGKLFFTPRHIRICPKCKHKPVGVAVYADAPPRGLTWFGIPSGRMQ